MIRRGFTVVELLIVIVVIGILATLTIIAYGGVQDNSRTAVLKSDLEQSARKLEEYRLKNQETLPNSLAAAQAAGIKASPNTSQAYYYEGNSMTYCLESRSTQNSSLVQSISSRTNSVVNAACTENALVSWWPFNGNANDVVGTNNGVVTNATLDVGQTGQSNTAYGFPGTAYIKPAALSLSTLDAFTVSVWSKGVAYTPGDFTTIVHRGAYAGIGNSVYFLGLNASGYLMAGVSGNYSPGTTTIQANASTWNLLTLVYAKNGWQFIYVNGVLQRSSNIGPITNTITSNELSFGVHAKSTTQRALNGAIDDIRIYDRALSATEVANLYSQNAQ